MSEPHPSGRLISSGDILRGQRVEDRRQILAPLIRTLIQRRDLDRRGLSTVLGLTLGKLQLVLEAESAFVLLIDSSVREFECLRAALPRSGARARRQRRRKALEGAKLPLERLGALATLKTPVRLPSVGEEEVPAPLQEAAESPFTSLIACPVAISQRLDAILVLANSTHRGGFKDVDLLLATEVSRHVGRAVQRGLGLGGPLSEEERTRGMALLAGVDYLEPDRAFTPNLALLSSIGVQPLARYGVLPLRPIGKRALHAAVQNPLDAQSITDFEIATGRRIRQKVAATASWIRGQLQVAFPDDDLGEFVEESGSEGDLVASLADTLREVHDEPTELSLLAEDVDESSAPIVRLANRLIEDAYLRGASDLHVEVHHKGVVIRHRIDGTCRERVVLPLNTARALVARLKIMSELDIAEHRLPQDGRLDFHRFSPAHDIDLRVSVIPMLRGEWVVMRILEKKRTALPLDELGFSSSNLERYRSTIRTPYGMILHCGPTGAGKSMTLYAALNEINDRRHKIVTAEDPIEYVLDGVGQMQVRPNIGLDFASALRHFLRHDPDVILVGEIRDAETARIAVDASLTGHLLLSTLHTNDATSSVARLVKLGIESFLVSSTLLSVCAQRLIRRLCHCNKAGEPTVKERAFLKRAKDDRPLGVIHRPVGCEHCNQLGYRGRTGVHELMLMSSRLRQQISEGVSPGVLKETARSEGMRTLFEDCLEKVKLGVTSLEETFRVAQPDEVI